jgi:hypothetical protein
MHPFALWPAVNKQNTTYRHFQYFTVQNPVQVGQQGGNINGEKVTKRWTRTVYLFIKFRPQPADMD